MLFPSGLKSTPTIPSKISFLHWLEHHPVITLLKAHLFCSGISQNQHYSSVWSTRGDCQKLDYQGRAIRLTGRCTGAGSRHRMGPWRPAVHTRKWLGVRQAPGRLQCWGILELLMNGPWSRTIRMNDPVSWKWIKYAESAPWLPRSPSWLPILR